MTAPSAQGPSAVHGGKGKIMSQRRAHVGARLKRRWLEFWGLVFFAGICINFAEIICRTLFHFSIDLMYDLPVWLTIWAVMMVAGNVANMPSLFQSVRFLTTAVASEMSYSSGLQRQALFSIALVLFLFIMLINVTLNALLKRNKEK